MDHEQERRLDWELIGERLKAERLRRGWSLRQASEHSRISHQQITRIENAMQLEGPSLDQLSKLAAVYGLRVGDVLGESEHEYDEPAIAEFVRVWEMLGGGEQTLVMNFLRSIEIYVTEQQGREMIGRVLGSEGDIKPPARSRAKKGA